MPGESAAEREHRLTELVAAQTSAPFDLETDWPLRARLFRLTDDDHVLCLVFHHIACDAWSTRILLTELSALYAAFTEYGRHRWSRCRCSTATTRPGSGSS